MSQQPSIARRYLSSGNSDNVILLQVPKRMGFFATRTGTSRCCLLTCLEATGGWRVGPGTRGRAGWWVRHSVQRSGPHLSRGDEANLAAVLGPPVEPSRRAAERGPRCPACRCPSKPAAGTHSCVRVSCSIRKAAKAMRCRVMTSTCTSSRLVRSQRSDMALLRNRTPAAYRMPMPLRTVNRNQAPSVFFGQ